MRAGRYLIALIFLLVASAALDTWLTRGIGTWETVFLTGLCGLWLAVAVIPWLPIPHKATVMSASLSLLVALYAFEAYMRLEWAFGTGDPSPKLLKVAALRSQGIKAYPALTPWSQAADPLIIEGRRVVGLSGIANVRTVFCNESQRDFLVFNSDPHGFRNPAEVWNEKIEVALLGDSFIIGVCVDDNAHIAARLRQRIPGTLTVAYGGNGPLIELAVLREYLKPLRPRIVVWFYYEGNDLFRNVPNSVKPSDLEHASASDILTRYLDPSFSQNLFYIQAALDRAKREHVNHLYNEQMAKVGDSKNDGAYWQAVFTSVRNGLTLDRTFRTVGFSAFSPFQANTLRLGGAPFSNVAAGYRNRFMPLFARILRRARDEVSGWGGKMFFVYLPDSQAFRENATHPLKQDVLKVARSLGMNIFDFQPVFKRHPDPESLFGLPNYSGHYSADGYALITRHLLPEIKKQLETD